MDYAYSKFSFPEIVEVTGQVIDVSILSNEQKQVCVDLLHSIYDRYKESGRGRFIVGITGPSGAGKSVLSAILVALHQGRSLPFACTTVTIDAFHYPNSQLIEMPAEGGANLKDYKGRFDTYDVESLSQKLSDFKMGQLVNFPAYSRILHDPVAEKISVVEKDTILLLDGLWLLREEDGWSAIKKQIDFSVFIETSAEESEQMTVERHVRGGRSVEEAKEFYQTVDRKNLALVMNTKATATKVISAIFTK